MAYKPKITQVTSRVVSSVPVNPLHTSNSSGPVSSLHTSNSPGSHTATHNRYSHAHKGVFRMFYTIATNEGPLVLYNGLTASIQRQVVFASVRIGCYDTVKQFYVRVLQG